MKKKTTTTTTTKKWKATHRIISRGETVYLMLCVDGRSQSGPAYTEAEWDASDNADYELVEGSWYFLGELIRGYVERRYECEGMRDVWARTIDLAAETFADRLARRHHGRGGVASRPIVEGHAADMSYAHYRTFLGTRNRDGSYSGGNVTLIVYPA